MTTLVLHLTGPLQSWGTESRFMRRGTGTMPSKSGVLGMLAAARGHRRTDELADELLHLRFGVRADQPGRLLREYQTARGLDSTGQGARQSERFYLSDAAFLAAVEGPTEIIEGLAESLQQPYYLPFLGRRSCPPARPVFEEVTGESLEGVLRDKESWLASRAWKRRQDQSVELRIVRDAESGDEEGAPVRDMPVSFDPRHRQYEWRRVVEEFIRVPNPDSNSKRLSEHDPFELLGG